MLEVVSIKYFSLLFLNILILILKLSIPIVVTGKGQ